MATVFTPTKVRDLKRGDEMWEPPTHWERESNGDCATVIVLKAEVRPDLMRPEREGAQMWAGTQSGASRRYGFSNADDLVVVVTRV